VRAFGADGKTGKDITIAELMVKQAIVSGFSVYSFLHKMKPVSRLLQNM